SVPWRSSIRDCPVAAMMFRTKGVGDLQQCWRMSTALGDVKGSLRSSCGERGPGSHPGASGAQAEHAERIALSARQVTAVDENSVTTERQVEAKFRCVFKSRDENRSTSRLRKRPKPPRTARRARDARSTC